MLAVAAVYSMLSALARAVQRAGLRSALLRLGNGERTWDQFGVESGYLRPGGDGDYRLRVRMSVYGDIVRILGFVRTRVMYHY